MRDAMPRGRSYAVALAIAAAAVAPVACRPAAGRGEPAPAAAPPPVEDAGGARDAASVAGRPLAAILVLGDSHVYGAFGERLHERLAALGRYAVISEGAGGATTETYLEERPEALVGYRVRETAPGERAPRLVVDRVRAPIDRLDDLLARYEPELVVIALGTNRPRAAVGESCEALVGRVLRDRPARRVVWIGPPAMRPDRSASIVASLRACVEKAPRAVFVDGAAFNGKSPLPRDNPHFGPADAARWADAVFAQIAPALDAGAP